MREQLVALLDQGSQLAGGDQALGLRNARCGGHLGELPMGWTHLLKRHADALAAERAEPFGQPDQELQQPCIDRSLWGSQTRRALRSPRR